MLTRLPFALVAALALTIPSAVAGCVPLGGGAGADAGAPAVPPAVVGSAVNAGEALACAELVALDPDISGAACSAVAGVLNAGLKTTGVLAKVAALKAKGAPPIYPGLRVDGYLVGFLPANIHDDARAVLAAHPEAMAALKAARK